LSLHDIDLTGFSAAQKQALFDLLILAMYADGHLSSVEDEQLQKLLAGMGFVDEIDRQREFDAAVTRIRPSMQSIYKAKELALGLAEAFTARLQQKQVYAAVEQIMTFDNNISTWENTLLSELRMKFRL
jgi:6-phosphogluconolactonase/glucosamine-6-phosphate isomerase/deaminase